MVLHRQISARSAGLGGCWQKAGPAMVIFAANSANNISGVQLPCNQPSPQHPQINKDGSPTG